MIVVYGATGFTGRLVARELVACRDDVVLAGRRAAALGEVARELGAADVLVGGLDDVDLGGATVVLNAAGPFSATMPPLLDACLAAGVPYLDLAGEVNEHRHAWSRDGRARAAGVPVVPGVGYGVAASDVTAALAASQVPEPVSVEIALKTVGGVSRGTAEVVLGSLRQTGVRRRDGRLVPVAPGAQRRRVDFLDGDGPTVVVTNPWRADLWRACRRARRTTLSWPFPSRCGH